MESVYGNKSRYHLKKYEMDGGTYTVYDNMRSYRKREHTGWAPIKTKAQIQDTKDYEECYKELEERHQRDLSRSQSGYQNDWEAESTWTDSQLPADDTAAPEQDWISPMDID